MRKVARLVAFRDQSSSQPSLRLIHLSLLHQIDANVVVGVAELRIQIDRHFAVANCLLDLPLEAQHPAEICMSIGRRMDLYRTIILIDGAIRVSIGMTFVTFLDKE